jgi:type II secretory pathway pseudopilin PulG
MNLKRQISSAGWSRLGGTVSLTGSRHGDIIRQRGWTLIECMVYISLLFIVLGLGYTAMYRSMDASQGLRRNANDITSAMRAGERWRDDVRNATGAIRVEKANEETILRLPQGHNEVSYRFATNSITRRTGQSDWLPVLEHVKNSSFAADQRKTVSAWRWEVELQTYRKSVARMRPLFTFIAVPAVNSAK